MTYHHSIIEATVGDQVLKYNCLIRGWALYIQTTAFGFLTQKWILQIFPLTPICSVKSLNFSNPCELCVFAFYAECYKTPSLRPVPYEFTWMAYSFRSMAAHKKICCWRRNWQFYILIHRKQEVTRVLGVTWAYMSHQCLAQSDILPTTRPHQIVPLPVCQAYKQLGTIPA